MGSWPEVVGAGGWGHRAKDRCFESLLAFPFGLGETQPVLPFTHLGVDDFLAIYSHIFHGNASS